MTRILSAAVLVPIAILAVLYAPPLVYLIGIGVVGTICLYEYFGLIRAMDIHAQPLFGCLLFWVLLFACHQKKLPMVSVLGLVLLAAFLSAMWRYKQPIRQRALALMAELLGVLYLSLFLYPALPIRDDFEHGREWTLILFIVIWTGDTVALLVGKKFGSSPFASVLSPKKTNEGAMGGLLGGLALAAAAQHFLFPQLPLKHVAAAAVLVGIFGQLGDLAESMLKRAAEIKDSSQLIPGHGGALDRMDSLLFAFPVLYFYLLQIYKG
jgi:phosphatidate cytidylyltransferase